MTIPTEFSDEEGDMDEPSEGEEPEEVLGVSTGEEVWVEQAETERKRMVAMRRRLAARREDNRDEGMGVAEGALTEIPKEYTAAAYVGEREIYDNIRSAFPKNVPELRAWGSFLTKEHAAAIYRVDTPKVLIQEWGWMEQMTTVSYQVMGVLFTVFNMLGNTSIRSHQQL